MYYVHCLTFRKQEKMSNHRPTTFNPKSKRVPIIVVPGFLTANDEQWGAFVAKATGHPVHLLNWESFSNSKMLAHAFKSIFTRGWLSSLTTPVELWKKACKEVDKVILSISNYITDNFHNTPFILLGHSLGGRIVSEVTFLIDNKNLLSTIVIAGAINRLDFDTITRSKDHIPSIGYINFFSQNDKILSNFYRAASLYQETPIGMVNSNGQRVINKVTDLGHSEYLTNDYFRRELSKCIYSIQSIYESDLAPSRPIVVG